jgi:hypothetical protein
MANTGADTGQAASAPAAGKKVRITLWVFEEDVKQLKVLAQQRRREDWSELARAALHDGAALVAIKGEPDRVSGDYGTLPETMMAEQVYLLTGQGIMWLERRGISIASQHVIAQVAALARRDSPLAGAATQAGSHIKEQKAGGKAQQAIRPLILSESDGPQESDAIIV